MFYWIEKRVQELTKYDSVSRMLNEIVTRQFQLNEVEKPLKMRKLGPHDDLERNIIWFDHSFQHKLRGRGERYRLLTFTRPDWADFMYCGTCKTGLKYQVQNSNFCVNFFQSLFLALAELFELKRHSSN